MYFKRCSTVGTIYIYENDNALKVSQSIDYDGTKQATKQKKYNLFKSMVPYSSGTFSG